MSKRKSKKNKRKQTDRSAADGSLTENTEATGTDKSVKRATPKRSQGWLLFAAILLLAAAASIDLAGAIYEPTLLSGTGARTALKLQAGIAALFIVMLMVGLQFYGAIGAAAAMVLAAIVRLFLFGIAARRSLAHG